MLVILADDVTGALDAAAPFAGRGLRTRVVLNVDAIEHSLRDEPDVLSIDLNCRECSPEAAHQLVTQSLSALPQGVTLFKKVDSRLKGNIAAELSAIPFTRALVAPAIPEFGRAVRAGHVEGFGVAEPISLLAALGGADDRYLIPDTMTEEQMQQALHTALAQGVDLLIGARGLAEALARSMTGMAEARPAEVAKGNALFVIGSQDPITLAQVAALRQAIAVDYSGAPNGHVEPRAPADGPVTLVQALPGQEDSSPEEVSRRLAEGVVPRLTDVATTWLLSGGATAQAVLAKAGITELDLRGECLPGLGVAEADGHCIIAKSGGFGRPHTLKDIAARVIGAI
ncbi:four-carbon acid sugar kinase family protein [Neorhizobium lilium]|uniref:Four-carbon acid sugar kinase family protein n=1 Tax=Neorhizobium lilium TaxID=2503024 RepID=A0A444LKK0_9HYPH|nr:four-carbon acid sugar kinase family protein [Neorhizobium lilium]RWX80818.1 four-carbon acid sugar kinase family protein [Neorhizobium lilium]